MTSAAPGRRSIIWRLRRLWYVVGLLLVASTAGVGHVLAQVPLPQADLPVETTFLFDTNGMKLAELSGGENRVSVPLDQVSPHLVDAVLAGEDRDFFKHPGVDVLAVGRATLADVRGQHLQGGSTITQQYVKNTYVGDERTLVRKLKEAVLAVKLERKLDKTEILERYLNTVYFGRGTYGAQAASRAYYGIDVGQLDARQSAYLAGLIRAPEAADVSSHPQEANRRRDIVVQAMAKQHKISKTEAYLATAEPVAAYTRSRGDVVHDRYVDAASGTPYVVELVRKQLQQLGFSDAQINGGGLRVTTSLDLDLQRAAYRAVYTDTLNQPDDPSGALVAVDTDGYVRAMVGGRDWDAASPYARVNFATGAAGGGAGRQPGSSFKPISLAALVAAGYTVESAFDAPPTITFPKADNGKPYEVNNFEKESFGRLNLVDATQHSVNTVYAQVVDALGPQRVVDMAHRLGIRSQVSPVLSVALGTPEVSVLEMADAYLTFATRGVRVDPAVIERVTSPDGGVLYQSHPRKQRALEPATADVVTYVLRQVIAAGTGTRAKLAVDAAGKTGTTQSNGDAWFVGFTPGLATAVWMGYPEGQTRRMDRVHGIAVTGGTFPAMAWKRFMDVATRDKRYAGSFGPVPDLKTGRLLANAGLVPATSSTTSSSTTSMTDGGGTTSTTATTAPTTTTTTRVTVPT